jgi:hypothetical protein
VTLTGADPDGDALTFTIVDQPVHGTLTGTAPDMTYQPADGFAGSDSFTFTASDAGSTSPPATVAIDVVNRPPTAENQQLSAQSGVDLAVMLGGSDQDGDTLSFAVVNPPAHGSLSGAVPALTYRSASGYSGPDSFTFTVSDGLATSPVATVALDVLAPPPASDFVSMSFVTSCPHRGRSCPAPYANAGTLTLGDIVVRSDRRGVTSVIGTGTLPGADGGTSAFSVHIVRLGRSKVSLGSVAVRDLSARPPFEVDMRFVGTVKLISPGVLRVEGLGVDRRSHRVTHVVWTIADSGNPA